MSVNESVPAPTSHRYDVRREPEGADFPGMIAKVRLDRNPPVWRNAADRALPGRIDAEGELRVGRQWAIAAEFEIEHVVEEAVGGEPDDLLRVYLLDERAGGRRSAPAAELMNGKLQAGIVFQTSWTVGLLLAVTPHSRVWPSTLTDFAIAYVRVVPAEAVGDAVICSLNEGAEIVGDPPAGKEADLLQDKIVVDAKSGCGAARLSGLGIRKSRLQHDRERRALPIAAAQRVAAELEAAAERRQLQKSGVAGRARLAGLARVEGQ